MTPPLSIYINDMENGIIWNVNSLADDTCLFSLVTNPTLSAFEINSDGKVIENWAYQWKTLFNTDPNKQAICKDWNNEFMTSTKKSKKFDINYKAVYAMRRCGKVFADCLPLLTIHHL